MAPKRLSLAVFKKSYRLIQKLKHSSSQDEAKRQAKLDEINADYQAYIDQAEVYVQRARVDWPMPESRTERPLCVVNGTRNLT